MVSINKQTLEELTAPLKPVVIDFFAPWCGPCKMLGKAIEELESEYDGSVIFAKCDVEREEQIAEEFGIRNVPTIILIKDGTQKKLAGALPKAKLKSEINEFFGLDY